jgi:hypothetical protein
MQEEKIDKLKFGELEIDPAIFTQGFVAGCEIKICHGECCHSGVYLDLDFKKNILQYKDIIKEAMGEGQIKDENFWFDDEEIEDHDFPSGIATGTNLYTDINGKEKCVFNDKNGFCSLQSAAMKNGMHKWEIKPAYCIMYPLATIDGVLTYDDSHSADLPYCGKDREENFTQTVFDATHEEVRHIFGNEFFDFLYEHYKKYYSPKYQIKIPSLNGQHKEIIRDE